ncbi:MAG TPA: ATP-dependent helicase [Prolixibacteraceae bacterium]|nr:ATP-dependent helicase [Prolixibacteraceae bacterium]
MKIVRKKIPVEEFITDLGMNSGNAEMAQLEIEEKQLKIEYKSSSMEDSTDALLDTICALAQKTKGNRSSQYIQPTTDLSVLKMNNFNGNDIPQKTISKIEELKSIIASIENRPANTSEIQFSKAYKIDYAIELNRAQLEAVTTITGPVLVIAGAGTGKTRVIVHRVAFMLENGILPKEILLLTFTCKAAVEMTARVQELLNDDNVEKVYGGTFHSFSNHILRKHARLLNIPGNFSIIDSDDSADTIDLVKSELKLSSVEGVPFPKKKTIQEIISSARNRNLTIKELIEDEFSNLVEYLEQIEMISQGYAMYKKMCRIFDYDDLMDVLRDALRDNLLFRQQVQDEFKYIMVDEYQDTNVVQKEIVELLSDAHRNILVVGDDAQSIYAFRGANYENILRFPQMYPDCKLVKIEQNYRSNQKILDFTNDIIRNAKIGYKKRLYSKITTDTLPLVKKFYDQQQEAEYIVSKILEYRERGIELNQVAVLVRAFWHARYIEVELNKRGISYIAVGGLAFNERKHVKDVISYLRIIENPFEAVAWHRVLTYLPGVGRVSAHKIIEKIIAEKEFTTVSFEKSKFSEELRVLMNMLKAASDNSNSLVHKLEIIKNYYTPILKATGPDYQIRLQDIEVLATLASQYDSLAKFLTDFALDPPSKRFGNKATPLIDEGEDKPLTISTIHSAKGLEWHSVFIPHALDGMIPSVKAIKNIEELEEERRLFYVACSRAKEDLIITMPSYIASYNGFMSYPSRFLVEISKDKYQFE